MYLGEKKRTNDDLAMGGGGTIKTKTLAVSFTLFEVLVESTSMELTKFEIIDILNSLAH